MPSAAMVCSWTMDPPLLGAQASRKSSRKISGKVIRDRSRSEAPLLHHAQCASESFATLVFIKPSSLRHAKDGLIPSCGADLNWIFTADLWICAVHPHSPAEGSERVVLHAGNTEEDN
jgi:hypothetical protein